jgi:hypothetical protein
MLYFIVAVMATLQLSVAPATEEKSDRRRMKTQVEH